MIAIGSLCSGYGGLESGIAAVTGVRVIWQAEVDPAASAVLARHNPHVPNLGNIVGRDWSATERPDILCAGFPCQPVSAAGRRLGTADPRWLWPAVCDAIAALRPQTVFLENVRNIVSIQKGAILDLITGDLRELGYRYRWLVMGACYVGAAHHRHRWFLRADRLTSGEPWSGHAGGPALCGAPRRAPVLPTPQARDGDGRGEGGETYWSARSAHRANGMPLGAAVAFLPTPTAVSYGSNREGAVQPERFGVYAGAVTRWERVMGRTAPAPTDLNGNGNPRLAPEFVEWLMGLPAGHVTGEGTSRNDALRLLGNGAVPQQVAAAWRLLSREVDNAT